jgi:hypothetical protein
MRISVDKNDPGYKGHFFPGVIIKCNNKIITGCFTADTDLGEVHKYVFNKRGEKLGDSTTGMLLVEILHGKVEIIFPPSTDQKTLF